ncbi:MAG: sigma-70 family RNA polymerase sigma factor [Bryobacteraceae bacterium]|nr:sigma-70 family RNA polymerase sigma factor [Bryobacteraceae bacterium]
MGSPDGFGKLLRQYQGLVFGLAWNFLHDEASAEEVAQDVFLELHRTLPSLESDAHVCNWLRRVTVHRCIDYVRRTRRDPRVGLEDAAEPAGQASEPDVFLSGRLRKLVASLPEKPRAVVLLRYQEDLEPAEIAGVLDIPVSTVKSHLQRSLAMLREKLERMQVKV